MILNLICKREKKNFMILSFFLFSNCSDMDSLWRLICYYIPIFICVLYAFVTVLDVIVSIRSVHLSAASSSSSSSKDESKDDQPSPTTTSSSPPPPSSSDISSNISSNRRLWMYPSLLLFSFGPTFLVGIVWLISPRNNVYVLFLLQYVTSSLFGVGLGF